MSVGQPARGVYIADTGFEGKAAHVRWLKLYAAEVLCPPRRNGKSTWTAQARRWFAGLRQMVETVFEKLHDTCRLSCDRPHDLTGSQTRVAAMIALHNFCIWLNRTYGRPNLAFADLINW